MSLLGQTPAAAAETARRIRASRRLRGHLIAGVLLCFGLPTLFGLPFSLLPASLVANLVFGVVFGLPLAWMVSRMARTTLGGALIGCGLGVALCTVQTAFMQVPFSLGTVLAGLATGILPGAIMGWHVEHDA
ncbi:MAG: hypothetical protein RLZZ127_1156 [Planctomycetota bacterium]|jgi:F0F1-type ATP synthase assembly protein I